MKVLITGGAGYIGTALSERLCREAVVEEIIIYDNLSRGNYNLFLGKDGEFEKCRFVEGDILDSRNLRKVVKEADVVFHLAAKVTTPFADQDAHLFEQVNHWGSAELSYAVEESDVKKLIYLSSVSVYGSGDEPKNDDSTLNPKTFYGISKMRGEEHIRRLSDKLETHIVRCGNVYGYNKSMRFDAVINKFMFEANFKGKINIHGDGHQHRAFVFIETVVNELVSIISEKKNPPPNPLPRGGTKNLVEHNFSVNDIAEVLKELYPELEMIFINNNMKLRELMVKSDYEDTTKKLDLLKERLLAFRSQLSF